MTFDPAFMCRSDSPQPDMVDYLKPFERSHVQSAYIARSPTDPSILTPERRHAAAIDAPHQTTLQMMRLKKKNREPGLLFCFVMPSRLASLPLSTFQPLLSTLDISVEVSANLQRIDSFNIHQNNFNFIWSEVQPSRAHQHKDEWTPAANSSAHYAAKIQ